MTPYRVAPRAAAIARCAPAQVARPTFQRSPYRLVSSRTISAVLTISFNSVDEMSGKRRGAFSAQRKAAAAIGTVSLPSLHQPRASTAACALQPSSQLASLQPSRRASRPGL